MLNMAIDEWYEGLKHLQLEDLKHGLDAYSGMWPPNLMQFKEACTWREGLPAPCYKEYSSDSKALEHLKSDADTGKTHLQKIKEMIK